ncbi:MAG TPA: trehalose-6-phosphate synthase, partial [Burkholderiaceae bacterium]|nr:trehalose-6-phosphate synthase [Burkholderiaceae bacterium]
MKTLQLQLRFLIPLLVALVAAALVVLPLMDQLTLRWFSRDLNTRGTLVAGALADSIDEAVAGGSTARLQGVFDRAARDERLVAVGLCSKKDQLVRHSSAYPQTLTCEAARDAAHRPDQRLELPTGAVHVGVYPAGSEHSDAGTLVLLHDLSFVDRRSQDTRQYLVIFMIGLGLVIALITVVVAQLSWRGWVSGMRAILRGEGLIRPLLSPPELQPVVAEVRARLRDLEDEFRRSQGLVTEWTPDRLRALLHTQLRGDQVIVVSNREPYIHVRAANGVQVQRPASGLVTAVEPVMRACSGTWI